MGMFSKIAKELTRHQGFGKKYKGKHYDDDDYDDENGRKGSGMRSLFKAAKKFLKKD